MDSLNQARMTIDSVDREMAKLFAERMQAAAVIAAYKEEHGLPVEDIAREDELIARNSGLVPPVYRPYYTNFLKQLINESKKYQNLLLSGMTIAFSGVEGAFAHVAAIRIFGDDAKKIPRVRIPQGRKR